MDMVGTSVKPGVCAVVDVIENPLLSTASLQILGNLLALAGICPFVGSISDLIGRRYIALIGASLLCIGMIVSSTARSMNIFIGRC